MCLQPLYYFYAYIAGIDFILAADSTLHPIPLNSLEHCICTTTMTNIRPDRDSSLVPPGYKPQSIRMSHRGRPMQPSTLHHWSTVVDVNPLTASAAYILVFIFYYPIKYHLLNMLKIKCDSNQQYLKTDDLHFVKSEWFSLTWSCGSRQRATTSSEWNFRSNNLAVKGFKKVQRQWVIMVIMKLIINDFIE